MEGTKIRLWRKTTKEGRTYLTGALSKVSRILVVEVDAKEDPKDPDGYAYIVPNRGPDRIPPLR